MRRRALLAPRPRRASREPVVPMINVVFLLLIFFLMTAQIVPPAPFDMTLPTAQGDEDGGQNALYINAVGEIAFGEARGATALSEAVTRTGDAALRIQADAALDASRLARVLSQLSALGAARIEIVTEGG